MPPSFARIRRNLIWIFKNIIWFSVGWFFRRTYLQEELPVVILNVKSSNNTRYIDDQLMIIEMAPCKRTVLAYDGPHMLTFPFIYFLISFISLIFFCFSFLFQNRFIFVLCTNPACTLSHRETIVKKLW